MTTEVFRQTAVGGDFILTRHNDLPTCFKFERIVAKSNTAVSNANILSSYYRIK